MIILYAGVYILVWKLYLFPHSFWKWYFVSAFVTQWFFTFFFSFSLFWFYYTLLFTSHFSFSFHFLSFSSFFSYFSTQKAIGWYSLTPSNFLILPILFCNLNPRMMIMMSMWTRTRRKEHVVVVPVHLQMNMTFPDTVACNRHASALMYKEMNWLLIFPFCIISDPGLIPGISIPWTTTKLKVSSINILHHEICACFCLSIGLRRRIVTIVSR